MKEKLQTIWAETYDSYQKNLDWLAELQDPNNDRNHQPNDFYYCKGLVKAQEDLLKEIRYLL